MKKILAILILLCAAIPSVSHAQAPFGGLIGASGPCTCIYSPGFAWHEFTPLFLGATPSAGLLAASVLPTLFSYYELHPGAWALGTYTPGVQACWMQVWWFCVPLTTLGLISPETGTSL